MRGGRGFRLQALLWPCILFVAGVPLGAEGVLLDSVGSPWPVSPPTALSLAFVLTNGGEETVEIQLTYCLPEGLRKLSAPERLTVPPGGTRTLLVTVFASRTLPHGVQHVIARAHSAMGSVHAEAKLVVLAYVDAELVLPSGGYGVPGVRVGYRFQVHNRGNVHEGFVLEVSSDWNICTPRQVIHLPPGAVGEAALSHVVPHRASPGEQGRIEATVRSLSTGAILDTKTVRTTAAPPPPEEVRRTLYPVLPGSLRWTGILSELGFLGEIDVRASGPVGPGGKVDVRGSLKVTARSVSLLRASLVYERQPLTLHGRMSGTLAGPRMDIWLRYRIPEIGVTVSGRFQPGPTELQLHILSGSLYAQLTCDRTGRWAVVGGLQQGGIRLEGRMAAGGVSGGITWGLRNTLSLQISLLNASIELTWASWEQAYGPDVQTAFSWRAIGPLQARAGIAWRADALQKLHIGVSGTEWGPGRWSVKAEVQRIASGSAAREQWSFRGAGAFTSGLCCGTKLGVNGELWVPVMGGSAGGVRWLGALQGAFHLGGTTHVQAELEVSAAGTALACSVEFGTASLTTRLQRQQIEFGLRLPADIPFPLLRVYGRVEGVVRLQGAGVEAEGMILKLGGQQALVGRDGKFRFPPMSPGEYPLTVASLPRNACLLTGAPRTVRVRAGEITEVEVSVASPALVSGRVGTMHASRLVSSGSGGQQGGIAGAVITVSNGVASFSTLSDRHGNFLLGPVCPGLWVVRVELPELVPPHRMERKEYPIRLRSGESKELILLAEPEGRTVRPLQTNAP